MFDYKVRLSETATQYRNILRFAQIALIVDLAQIEIQLVTITVIGRNNNLLGAGDIFKILLSPWIVFNDSCLLIGGVALRAAFACIGKLRY